jgi:hypothetical protein
MTVDESRRQRRLFVFGDGVSHDVVVPANAGTTR